MSFDWLLGDTGAHPLYSNQGLLPVDSLPSTMPALSMSSASSPDSTEDSEYSPPVNLHHGQDDIAITGSGPQKRKSASNDAAIKDVRLAQDSQHTHDSADSPEAGKNGKNNKGPISEKRRDQNRAAQRAFRERKEKHVKDLEDRVRELEDANRERDHQNENLRDLVNQLRKENERLGAGANKFAQSAFNFDLPASSGGSSGLSKSVPAAGFSSLVGGSGSPSSSTPFTLPSFPAVTSGALSTGGFLRDLGPDSLASTSASSSASPPDATASGIDLVDDSAYALFTPRGEHLNFTASPFGISDPAAPSSGAGGGPTFTSVDDFLVDFTTGDTNNGSPFLPASLSSTTASATTKEYSVPIISGPATGGTTAISSSGQVEEAEIENLCAEMKTKATCQEYARRALEEALQQDVKAYAAMRGE